ncbi:MAG: class I SAM-dependent methyltransferase, partial [Rhodothermales bacterium]|nr:class I SAM-dependent methyltransferase [Rhodothermales bacterium]
WYVRRELGAVFSALDDRGEIRALDAGSGFGQYTYFMLRRFRRARVTAVDLKEDYLKMSERFISTTPFANRSAFAVDDLTDLRTRGPFDIILSVDVMEHIENDDRVLQNFERVLAPGGFVLINAPSDMGGSGVFDEGDEGFIGEHVRDGYGMQELCDKLTRAGLTVLRARYSYGPFGSAAWKLSIQTPMMLLSASWLALALLIPYYMVILPISLVLNAIDVSVENRSGTGLLMVAQKSAGEPVVMVRPELTTALN